MTEEEKKAIEKIKELEKLTREATKERNTEETQKLYKKYADYYLIVLNLIEKLQKENEELRKLTEFQKEYRNKLEQDLFENCSNFVVPKDKIKEKIKQLENKREQLGIFKSGIYSSGIYKISLIIAAYKELLEEG